MRNYFAMRQQELHHAYKTSSSLGHSLPKGHERELIASQFLTTHLPQSVDLESGVLVDQSTLDFRQLSQSTSPQLDLVVSRRDHPRLRYYGGTHVLFAESVAAVLEVKSRLTTAELQAVDVHCRKVKSRRRQVVGLWAGGADGKGRPDIRVPYYLVCFESAISSRALLNTLGSIADPENALDGLFVLDPQNGQAVLKDLPIHPFGGQTRQGVYLFADAGTDVLLLFWLVLLGQIDTIKLLFFPHTAYAKGIFGGGP